MTAHLSTEQKLYAAALTLAAEELGLVGVFQPGKRHDKFRVCLPDGTPVLLPVYKTPRGDAQGYAALLPGHLRSAISRNLERRGKT